MILCSLSTIFPLAFLALYPVDMNSSSPSACFSAQTIPGQFGNDEFNPDVGGAAVALSSEIYAELTANFI